MYNKNVLFKFIIYIVVSMKILVNEVHYFLIFPQIIINVEIFLCAING